MHVHRRSPLAGRVRAQAWFGWLRHPQVALALKAGLAAGLAWQLGSVLPDPLSSYPYYAAIGALSVMYVALSDAVIEAFRVVAAIATGILLAGATYALPPYTVFTVAAVVAIGLWLSGLPFLGQQGSWVPMSAVFVLTASQGEPEAMGLAYVLQVVLGALVGVAVNALVFPSLALHALEREMQQMRELVVEQLRLIGDALRTGEAPAPKEWRQALYDLSPPREALRQASLHSRRARVGNLRARRRRWRSVEAELDAASAALERVAWLVENLSISLFEFENADRPRFGTDFSRELAAAVDAVAGVIDAEPHPEESAIRAAEKRIDDVLRAAESNPALYGDNRRIAVGTALDLRRCLRTYVGHQVA